MAELTPAQRKAVRRRRRWMKRGSIAALLGCLAAAGAWGFDDAPAKPGLKGLLPEGVPSGLAVEAFAPLGPNWTEWSQATVQAVEDFYKLEGDAAAQRAKLAALKTRLNVIAKALADSKYGMIHAALLNVRGPLLRRVALAEAMLDTLEQDPAAARTARLARSAGGVAEAVAALEKDLAGVKGGSAWLPYIHADALKTAWAQSTDNDATVAALKATKDKLAGRSAIMNEAQKAFFQRPAFLGLESAIDAHLAALAPAAADPAKLREQLGVLAGALEEYVDANTTAAARKAQSAFQAVQAAAADGGERIAAVLNEHYFNDNIRLVATEQFLSKLLADARTEQGQVSDYVLGASVGGWQTTTTNVSVDLKPSPNTVRFDLVLNGTVQSNTAGVTDQATIYTAGYHTFRATKEVAFDGSKFSTRPALISVSANNTPTGATTRASGLPIFGRMAQRIAMQEAAARRPQSEAIAASRVQDRVLPKFNEEVDKAFNKAGRDLESELQAGLKATGLFPDRQRYESTDSAVKISTRLMGAGELAGGAPESLVNPAPGGAVLALHESVINNTIDRLDIAGKTMTEEELRHHLEGFLSKALAREFKFRSPAEAAKPTESAEPLDEEEKVPAKLVFAKEDPLRIQFRQGLLYITIRAGLDREGKDPIPMQEIIVPVRVGVDGAKITLAREGLQIAGIEGDLSPIQRKVINTKIGAALPDRTVDGKVKLKGPSREVDATVAGVQLVDGWVAVSVK